LLIFVKNKLYPVKIYNYLFVVLLGVNLTFAQKTPVKSSSPVNKPKLVVGIIVDQMRYDFLYRFYDKYSEFGIKKMMNQGFNCRNNQYHYASTVTGPGHAHVYNGSSPAISGIIGNEWYNSQSNKSVYVVEDSLVKTVGNGSEVAGKMSPKNMKVITVTDQLRIASQFNSKVIGVAIKDRGAILPAGHSGTAFWYDSKTNNWISSSHYMEKLPEWVNVFNNQKLPEKYTANLWTPLLDLKQYSETEEDDQAYEANLTGESKAVFPHKVQTSNIANSPYGNTLTTDFALAALSNEKLGKGSFTDFLAISYSSPDYVGHSFGPQSKEIEDVYLKLDLEIKRLLENLDNQVGVGNYTVFLSADHGVAEIPAFLKKNKVNAGLFLGTEIEKLSESILDKKFGDGQWVLSESNYQLYLNTKLLDEKKIELGEVVSTLQKELLKVEGIYQVLDLNKVSLASMPSIYREKLINIYNPKRSGEIIVLPEPAWFSGYVKGTTHGTMYAYDTHVPLLFYGFGIKKGETMENTYISDIAPTISMLLKILEPNGSIGKPIVEVLK
jgi:predicted AlkP superfamily pyrophosphatase or phosphodiesterase